MHDVPNNTGKQMITTKLNPKPPSENDRDFYKLLTFVFTFSILLLKCGAIAWYFPAYSWVAWVIVTVSTVFLVVVSNKLYEKYYSHPNWHRQYTKLRFEPRVLWGKLRDRKHVAKQFMLWPLPALMLALGFAFMHWAVVPLGLISGVAGWKAIRDPAHWKKDYDPSDDG
jgi:hypothetical protein